MLSACGVYSVDPAIEGHYLTSKIMQIYKASHEGMRSCVSFFPNPFPASLLYTSYPRDGVSLSFSLLILLSLVVILRHFDRGTRPHYFLFILLT